MVKKPCNQPSEEATLSNLIHQAPSKDCWPGLNIMLRAHEMGRATRLWKGCDSLLDCLRLLSRLHLETRKGNNWELSRTMQNLLWRYTLTIWLMGSTLKPEYSTPIYAAAAAAATTTFPRMARHARLNRTRRGNTLVIPPTVFRNKLSTVRTRWPLITSCLVSRFRE